MKYKTEEHFIVKNPKYNIIYHALLKEEQNPFTRAKLTTAELEEFNATPRVQEALVKLKADIAAYLVQRRAELGR